MTLAGVPHHHGRSLLAELTRTELINEHVPGRYTFHDLLRAYATELARHGCPDSERRHALHRMFDQYLHTAVSGATTLEPHRDPITVAEPRADVTAEVLTDQAQATSWFSSEQLVLLAVIPYAARSGFVTHAWQLAWALAAYSHRHGRWAERPGA